MQTPKVTTLIVAHDWTTHGLTNYWKNALLFAKGHNIPSQTIIMFNTSATHISLQEFEGIAKSRKGTKFSHPQCVPPELVRGSNIAIFMTGTTGISNILKCDDTLSFNYIEIHFYRSRESPINLISALPFIRKGRFRIYIDNTMVLGGSRGAMVLSVLKESQLDSITFEESNHPWDYIPTAMCKHNIWLLNKFDKEFQHFHNHILGHAHKELEGLTEKFQTLYKDFCVLMNEQHEYPSHPDPNPNDKLSIGHKLCDFKAKSATYFTDFASLCEDFEKHAGPWDVCAQNIYEVDKKKVKKGLSDIFTQCHLVSQYFNSDIQVRKWMLVCLAHPST